MEVYFWPLEPSEPTAPALWLPSAGEQLWHMARGIPGSSLPFREKNTSFFFFFAKVQLIPYTERVPPPRAAESFPIVLFRPARARRRLQAKYVQQQQRLLPPHVPAVTRLLFTAASWNLKKKKVHSLFFVCLFFNISDGNSSPHAGCWGRS